MLPLLSPDATVVALSRLQLETSAPIQFLDITDQVANVVRDSRLRDGLVSVFSRHTTLALRIQENEPLLLEDLKALLARLAPTTGSYRHNDFTVRTEHMHPDESPNGHAHCLHLLLGATECVPVFNGELQLGAWQRLFAIELDGPRAEREILVQTLGVVDQRPATRYTLPFEHKRSAA